MQSIEKLNQVKKSFDSKKTYLVIIDLNSYDDIVFFNKVKNLKNLYFNNIQSVCVEDLIRSDEVIYSESSFESYFGGGVK